MADIDIDINPQQSEIDASPSIQTQAIPIEVIKTLPTSYIATLAMPSNVYEDLTLDVSGSFYKAPASGYLSLNKRTGSTGFIWASIEIYDTNDNLIYTMEESRYQDSTSNLSFLVPIQKNYKAKISYNATGTTETFRFIYAEGSKNEAI
jgi:hypothetical protein